MLTSSNSTNRTENATVRGHVQGLVLPTLLCAMAIAGAPLPEAQAQFKGITKRLEEAFDHKQHKPSSKGSSSSQPRKTTPRKPKNFYDTQVERWDAEEARQRRRLNEADRQLAEAQGDLEVARITRDAWQERADGLANGRIQVDTDEFDAFMAQKREEYWDKNQELRDEEQDFRDDMNDFRKKIWQSIQQGNQARTRALREARKERLAEYGENTKRLKREKREAAKAFRDRDRAREQFVEEETARQLGRARAEANRANEQYWDARRRQARWSNERSYAVRDQQRAETARLQALDARRRYR